MWRVIDFKTGEGGDTPHQSHNHERRIGDGRLEWYDHFLKGDNPDFDEQDPFRSKVRIFVMGTGDEYELLGTNALGEFSQATPAIAGDRLLVRTQHRLWSIRSTADRRP